MFDLFVLIIVTTTMLVFISFLFKRIGKQLLFPLIFAFLSLFLLWISFIVSGWEGMGLGVVSIAILISSIIALSIVIFKH